MANNLEKLFAPENIAVVGASHDETKLGTLILKNIIDNGFKGDVYPVNVKGGKILGLNAYKDLLSIPHNVDLAVIVIPAKYVLDAVIQATEKNVKFLIVISAGFKETGKSGAKLEEEIKSILVRARKDGKVTRLVGVNCLGVTSYKNLDEPLNATFLANMPGNGKVAFVSQSGAFGAAAIDWALGSNLGFRYFVSIGNKTDLNELDFFEYFDEDPEVNIIAGYLENIADGKRFLDLASRITLKKPLILILPGESKTAQKAISSHTGSLVSDRQGLELAVKKSGVIRVENIRQLFNTMLLINSYGYDRFRDLKNLMIVTNAGGPGVLTTDLIEKYGYNLAKLSDKTTKILKEALPFGANSHGPIDVLGDAKADRYKVALENVLKDKSVDATIVLLTPQVTTEPIKTAEIIVNVQRHKPVLPVFIGGRRVKHALTYLKSQGVTGFSHPDDVLEVISKMRVDNTKLLPTWADVAHVYSEEFDLHALKQIAHKLKRLKKPGERLDPKLTDEFLRALKLPLPKSVFIPINSFINSGKNKIYELLKSATKTIKMPWAIKLASSSVLHATDIKGVYLNIKNKEQALKVIKNTVRLAKRNNWINNSTYIQIQEQINVEVEMFAGLKQDKQFGHILAFGWGGIYTELVKDIQSILLPETKHMLKQKLLETKVSKVLQGARGKTVYNIDAIVDVLYQIGLLAYVMPDLKEADFNPLVINKQGAFLVDYKIL